MESFTEAAGSPYTRGHAPGSVIGDGSFDLLANLKAMPTHEILPGYWACGSLLTALLVSAGGSRGADGRGRKRGPGRFGARGPAE